MCKIKGYTTDINFSEMGALYYFLLFRLMDKTMQAFHIDLEDITLSFEFVIRQAQLQEFALKIACLQQNKCKLEASKTNLIKSMY